MKTYLLSFPILNTTTFPLDHGYLLFSALSKICPALHGNKNISVLPVSGDPCGLNLRTNQSSVTFRIVNCETAEDFNPLLSLAYQQISFFGAQFYLGAPRVSQPSEAQFLYSRLVIYNRITKEDEFLSRVMKDLEKYNIVASVKLGKQRSLTVHGKKIYGWAVLIQDLKPEDSILLQSVGLGSKQRCGCGSFCPVKQ